MRLQSSRRSTLRRTNQVLGLKADMTKPAEVTEVVRHTEQHFGPIDVLFANTGGLLKRSRCVDATLELWQEAISLNLLSTFLVVQAALRSMEPRKSGSIVLMSSLAGFDGGGHGASHYAATKGAVATLVRSLAKEVGTARHSRQRGCAGSDRHAFPRHIQHRAGQSRNGRATPLRREGTPQDVAGAVLYLASNRAAFVTGEVIQINGGTGF